IAAVTARLAQTPKEISPYAALGNALLEVYDAADPEYADLLLRMQVMNSDPRLVAHHAGRWSEMERELVSAVATRQGTNATQDEYSALVVATILAACRVAVAAWCRNGGDR